MLMFKKDKEFLFKKNKDTYRILVTNVKKNTKGEIDYINTIVLDNNRSEVTFTPSELKDFDSIVECITNTEIFIMYTNWANFFRQGIHQDLEYAERIKKSIFDSIKERGTVSEGTGKLESFDTLLLDKIIKGKI